MIYQDILYIVVQEDGYRIVKKEHKTSRIKANEDFDLHDMEQIRAYHYLEELLPELVIKADGRCFCQDTDSSTCNLKPDGD